MKLPLSFVPGKLERGLLLKNPLVIDADGNRVVAIGFTPALHPATIEYLDAAAALFAAAPDMRTALEQVLARFDLMSEQLPPEQCEDAANCSMNAHLALGKSRGVIL